MNLSTVKIARPSSDGTDVVVTDEPLKPRFPFQSMFVGTREGASGENVGHLRLWWQKTDRKTGDTRRLAIARDGRPADVTVDWEDFVFQPGSALAAQVSRAIILYMRAGESTARSLAPHLIRAVREQLDFERWGLETAPFAKWFHANLYDGNDTGFFDYAPNHPRKESLLSQNKNNVLEFVKIGDDDAVVAYGEDGEFFRVEPAIDFGDVFLKKVSLGYATLRAIGFDRYQTQLAYRSVDQMLERTLGPERGIITCDAAKFCDVVWSAHKLGHHGNLRMLDVAEPGVLLQAAEPFPSL